MPFTETLHMTQRDLYDIDTMLLTPLKKQKRNAKHKKIAWNLCAGAEHAIGITFGILAITTTYDHRYIMGGFYFALMTSGAMVAFNAGNIAKSYANIQEQLNEKIGTIQTTINFASPEKIHEIAEIARNIKHR